MKGQIEIMRSSNTFGTLIWQLNENWPTGGWGIVEYGPSRILEGQLVGGRWKPLMYLLRQSLFRDVFAACGKDDRCYIRNDGVHPVDASIWLEAWNLRESKATRAITCNQTQFSTGRWLPFYPALQSASGLLGES